jgi:hypothetical protein
MARRATASRMDRIAREKRERDAELAILHAQAEALAKLPDTPDTRRNKVEKQIDRLLSDMERAKDLADRLRIAGAVERLWKLVEPTAGALRPSKPGKSSRSGPLAPVGDASEPQAAQPDTTS